MNVCFFGILLGLSLANGVMTSYFLGGRKFMEVLTAEQKRLGGAFKLKDFMDTIMQVGPVPIDEFASIFK